MSMIRPVVTSIVVPDPAWNPVPTLAGERSPVRPASPTGQDRSGPPRGCNGAPLRRGPDGRSAAGTMLPVTMPTEPSPAYRLTDAQRDLRDAVRILADEQVAPRAAEIDRTAEFPWDLKDLLAKQDILALPFPVEHGGLGGDLLSVCLVIEQLSRACATTGLILAVQELASLPIVHRGHAGAAGPLAAEARQRRAPDRVRADRGRGRLRRGRRPDPRRPRRRRVRAERLQAVHQPGLGGGPHHGLRGDRPGRRRSTAA